MNGYEIVSIVSFVGGVVARHFIQSKYLPLSADAKRLELALESFRASVVSHIDAMVNKSEIMIRHDAQVFRNSIAVK
jgi:hypothetical protein